MFSLEARMAHKGRQGSGAADGSDINRVAPAGLAEPSVLCRRTVVLLCLSQALQGGFQNPSPYPTGCFGSIVAQAPKPA